MACFLRPDYEELTHLVSSYLGLAVENAGRLGLKVYDLYGGDAVWDRFSSTLNAFNPEIVCFGGHGLENILYGQDGTTLLTSCVNDEILSGRLVFALACKSAVQLGPSSVGKGCLAYFGWLDDVVIIMDESYPPLKDPYAYSFMKPVLDGLDVLFRNFLAGADIQTLARNVYERVISSYNNEIAYWRAIPTATASQMLTYLIHDRDNFVPITATGIYTPPARVTVEIPLTPILFIGALTLPLAIKK